jgi:hypothetical protein
VFLLAGLCRPQYFAVICRERDVANESYNEKVVVVVVFVFVYVFVVVIVVLLLLNVGARRT